MYKYTKYEINDDKEKSEKVVTVTLEDTEVQKSVENAAKKIQIKAKLKGFRPGHAPMDVVMNTFQREILDESSRDLFNDILDQIIKNEKFVPIATTQVANEEKDGTDIVLTFRIPVYPEVEIAELDGLGVEKKDVEITDEEVNDGIKRIWASYKKEEDSEEPTFTAEIFEQINIPTVKDEESLKEWVKDSIKKFKEGQLKSEFGRSLLDKALDKSTIPVHEQVINSEMRRKEAELDMVVQRNKTTLEDLLKSENLSVEEYKEQLKQSIVKTVQTEIFLRELAKKWNIVIDEDELQNELKNASNLASTYGNNPEYIREIVKDALLRDKAFTTLVDKFYDAK